MQRCRARSKRSGEQCKNYAIKKWGVCRMHGAKGGPKTIHGNNRCKFAPLKHGCYTKEEREGLSLLRKLTRADYNFDNSDLLPNPY